MLSAGKKLWYGILTAWDGFWSLWLANIFWLLLCLPIITMPLAFTGLYFSMHELANGESMEWSTFFAGIRQHFWLGMRWFAFTFTVILLLIFYFNYLGTASANSNEPWLDAAAGIPLGLLILWLILNTFTFPLMLEQQKPSFLAALRSSVAFYLKWPGCTLAFVLFNAAVIALCTWLYIPWLILGASLTALMANMYVRDRIEEVTKRVTD